jgi:hypothetical protein
MANFLFMVNSYESNKKIAMKVQGVIAQRRKKIKIPKHAKGMILKSVQVPTFILVY